MMIAAWWSGDTKVTKGQRPQRRLWRFALFVLLAPLWGHPHRPFKCFPLSINRGNRGNGGPVMRRTLFCITRFVSLALLVTILTSVASAQFKASIQGTITDSNGAVISGAKVTLINK